MTADLTRRRVDRHDLRPSLSVLAREHQPFVTHDMRRRGYGEGCLVYTVPVHGGGKPLPRRRVPSSRRATRAPSSRRRRLHARLTLLTLPHSRRAATAGLRLRATLPAPAVLLPLPTSSHTSHRCRLAGGGGRKNATPSSGNIAHVAVGAAVGSSSAAAQPASTSDATEISAKAFAGRADHFAS